MTEKDTIEKLNLQIQRLEAKVFRNQNLNIKPQLDRISARQQAESISDGESENYFIGKRTRESAIQRVKSFEQNYDEGAVKNLYGAEISKYEKEKAICDILVERYNIVNQELK